MVAIGHHCRAGDDNGPPDPSHDFNNHIIGLAESKRREVE
jgi:hypothetical protein